LKVLERILPAKGVLLEIASGTGEHAAFMAPQLGSGWTWQPSELSTEALEDIDSYAAESNCKRIRPALVLDVTLEPWPLDRADAILCCNMIHIAPWEAAKGLFAGAARILPPNAPLILYGPFKRNGEHTAPSNAEFDATFLKQRNPLWGVRCLDTEVTPLAEENGFALDEFVQMPANNLSVIFRRKS
jgi:cyclopropane fatty-acyl-phospholipid synthase-like methyltransferase